MWIVRLALRYPYTIGVLSFVILLLGSLAVMRMRVDIFPTVNIPVVAVVWNYPGLSATDMERRIVLVSERAYSTAVSGISRIESKSIRGVGVLKLYFEPDANIGGAIAQIASVSLTAGRNMPPGTQPPIVLQYNASNVPVAQVTATSDTLSEQQVFDYGLNFLRIRLFTIPGLATPSPYGGKTRQIMVDLDPAAASAKGLAPADVVQSLLESNLAVPAGTARIGDLEYDVEVNNSPTTIEDFNRIPLKGSDEHAVLLGDVARVHDGFATQENIVHVNGKRGTYLTILKKASASTLMVVEGAKSLLPGLQASAPKGIELKLDFDQSIFVRAAIRAVLKEALVASLLVGLMILAFLGSWRSVAVVTISIPLAIFASLLCLYWSGETLNIMVLSGLALAIGMLVDDATVEVENIHRNRDLGQPLVTAILEGARQVALPAIAATSTVCIVLAPVFLLTGPARFLFAPMALAVIFAMTASYVLSRTLVPVLSRRLLGAEQHLKFEGGGLWAQVGLARAWVLGALQGGYRRVLEFALQYRKFTLVLAAGFSLVTVSLGLLLGCDFFPEVDAGQMRLHVRTAVGTRIEGTERIVAQVEGIIRTVIPESELQTINDNIGLPSAINLAYVQTDNIGGQDAEVLVALRPKHRPTAGYRARLRDMLAAEFPSAQFYFQPADIVSQILNFGLSAPVDVQVEGKDLAGSAEIARKIRDGMRAIPGTADVHIVQVLESPTLELDVDRERAALVGVAQRDVADNLLTSLSSSVAIAPSFWINPQNNVNYLVAVQTPLARMRSVQDLLATPLTSSALRSGPGPAPYLGSVATVHPSEAMALISHEAVQPVIDVQCNVEARSLAGVSRDIDRLIDSLGQLPPGSRIHVRGQIESMYSSFKGLGLGMLLAIVLVYLLLVVLFQSLSDPLVVMAAVPGALGGVVWMLALTGTSVNVESLMGAVLVVGVAVSNSILLVTFAKEERSRGVDPVTASLKAGAARLRPVLMTAFAMIFGMLPMAFGTSEGAEQNAPLGRAVVGGLMAATFFTLLVVPVIHSLVPPKALLVDDPLLSEAGAS